MGTLDAWGDNRCFGSMTVGPKGQVVIPANARKELGIAAADTLLVFTSFHNKGLVLIKAGVVEEVLDTMSQRLSYFERLVKDGKLKTAEEEKGD